MIKLDEIFFEYFFFFFGEEGEEVRNFIPVEISCVKNFIVGLRINLIEIRESYLWNIKRLRVINPSKKRIKMNIDIDYVYSDNFIIPLFIIETDLSIFFFLFFSFY